MTENLSTKIRVQPLEWFEKNCYKDISGDWWESEAIANVYFDTRYDIEEASGANEKFLYVGGNHSEAGIGDIVDAPNDHKDSWKWAVEEYITKEEYPEMFL